MVTGLTEAVAAVLAAHATYGWDGANHHRCVCGEALSKPGQSWLNATPRRALHVAAAVESVVAAERAEDRARLADGLGMAGAGRKAMGDHFVMWHELDDLAGPSGEWRCGCGLKFGFSDSAIDHTADMVRAALAPTAAHDPTP